MIIECPINHLSLGNVSFNFLREIWRSNLNVEAIVPVASNFDFSSYKVDEDFREFLAEKSSNYLKKLNWDTQTLKVWHIEGSEKRLSKEQFLYTFYEVDSPTQEEIAIVKNQTHVFFSSSESAVYFQREGCENVSFVPLGFDEDFKVETKKLDGIIHFGLIGKLERRKNTQRIIKLWLEKFGNNPKYQLSCLVHNPFFPKEFYDKVIRETLGGKLWSNINFLNPLESSYQVAQLQNSVDIDLSGISNGEGWGLPAFNATCLGKWSVVSDCSGHKDWATKDNCILIPVSDKQPCYDGLFFKQGNLTNQGSYYKIEDEVISSGMDKAVEKCSLVNEAGLKLGQELTYKNTLNKIRHKMGNPK